MKFYLSSYRIPAPGDLIELIGKTPEQTKVALIPNAQDYYADRARACKIKEVLESMRAIGFQPDVIDLKEYTDEELKTKLAYYDFIWVTGGNTFCLRHEMKKSGFDKIIQQLLESGLIWGGDSAGAVIVGPSLRGVEFADEPDFAQEQIYEGLNLIPQVVIPHADNVAYGDAITRMIDMYSSYPDRVTLNDNQAFVIDGNRSKIVTTDQRI